MATAIPFPGWQTGDANGTPESGGKIYFYVVGTTTPIITYSDTALTTPNANPVVMDASGWVAPIYISSETAYDYIVKSADEATTLKARTTVPSNVSGAQPVDATLTAIAGLVLSDGDIVEGTGTDTVRAIKRWRDSYAELQAITTMQANDVCHVTYRTTAGDGGGGMFRWVTGDQSALVTLDTESGIAVPPTSAPTGASGVWLRQYEGAEVWVEWFGAAAGGAVCSDAFNAAMAWLDNQHSGGKVRVGPGTFNLDNTNTGAASWDNYRCIYMAYDNIAIEGSGRGITTLFMAANEDAHAIQIGSRTTTVLVVHGCSVRHLTLDHNRANNVTPTDAADHQQGIAVQSNCTNIELEDLHIKNCVYYGIGFQRDGFINCTVRNVLIEDCGADGIDCKNDDGTGYGNIIEDVEVRRFGLVGTLSLSQAGIDIRSGWTFNNVRIVEFGTAQGLHAIRYNTNADSNTNALQGSPGSNFYVRADTTTSTVGLRSNALLADFVNGECYGCGIGAQITQREGSLTNIRCDGGIDGIQLENGTAGTNGDGITCTGVVARGNSGKGWDIINADDATLVGCTGQANGTNLSIDASCTNTRILGGTFRNQVTTNVSDLGTLSIFSAVGGVKTEAHVESAALAIDAVAVVTVLFTHGLAFTPATSDVQLTLLRDTNVNDWHGNLRVVATSASQISAQLNVFDASATGAATVKAIAHVRVKTGA